MQYQDFGDILDHLQEIFDESCENHENEKSDEEFKMKVYFDIRQLTVDIPKLASEIAYKMWLKK